MAEVVKGVDLTALGTPHETLGGMLEIRFTNTDGHTEVWMVKAEDLGTPDFMRDNRVVKLAYLDSGVDSRVGLLLQQNSAFRDHIVDHHRELAELGADWSCHAGVLAVPPKGTTADAEKAG